MLGFLLLPLFALAAGHPRHQVFIKSGSKLTKISHYWISKSKTNIPACRSKCDPQCSWDSEHQGVNNCIALSIVMEKLICLVWERSMWWLVVPEMLTWLETASGKKWFLWNNIFILLFNQAARRRWCLPVRQGRRDWLRPVHVLADQPCWPGGNIKQSVIWLIMMWISFLVILRNTTYQVWSYDVDVSNVACKCNAAMYWVNMPGYENGNPYPAE